MVQALEDHQLRLLSLRSQDVSLQFSVFPEDTRIWPATRWNELRFLIRGKLPVNLHHSHWTLIVMRKFIKIFKNHHRLF